MPDNPESDPVYETWINLVSRTERDGYASLSVAGRVFWCVYELDLEVYRGGFLAYFGNTEGRRADEVVASLITIGAHQTAALVERIFRLVFPDGVPAEPGPRRELASRLETDYENLQGEIETLEDQYCQDPDALFDKLHRYARNLGFLVA